MPNGIRSGWGSRTDSTCLDVGRSGSSVLFGFLLFVHHRFSILIVLKAFLQVRDTPAAPGPCSSAFAQLTRATRLMDSQKVHHFSAGDMKAVAEFVIQLHEFESSACSIVTGDQERRSIPKVRSRYREEMWFHPVRIARAAMWGSFVFGEPQRRNQ